MNKRSVIAAADAMTEALISQRLRERVGRHLLNRARGDNETDMQRNGEGALLARLEHLLAGWPAVVLDVGANVGEWSAQLAPRLDRSASLYAFEPVAAIHARLVQTLGSLGSSARLVPVHAALGEQDGETEITLYGGGMSGANSLHERDAPALGMRIAGREVIQCRRGDTFCREQGIERIAFVKLDVEGNELAVLRGLSAALAEQRIDALQFEYGGNWIDARIYLKDAFAMLLPLGYAVGKLYPDGIHWYDRYDYRLETFQYANFVAARPEWRTHLSGG